MRVSTADQSTDLQRDALLAAGVAERDIYLDKASGKQDDRPGLEACLRALRPADTLLVWKLDRLGRSLGHLVATVQELADRQVAFKVLTGHGANIDTGTASGKLIFGIFAALAEFERELISERTRAGLAAARARGRKGGRKPKLSLTELAGYPRTPCSRCRCSTAKPWRTSLAFIARRFGERLKGLRQNKAPLPKHVGRHHLRRSSASPPVPQNNSSRVSCALKHQRPRFHHFSRTRCIHLAHHLRLNIPGGLGAAPPALGRTATPPSLHLLCSHGRARNAREATPKACSMKHVSL